MCQIVLKAGSLKLPEILGPLQASTGIAFSFYKFDIGPVEFNVKLDR